MANSSSSHRFLSVALALVLSSACVQERRALSQAEREQLRPFVTQTAPTPAHALDIQFGSKIKLIGYDVTPERARAGEAITITWYWQALAAPGNGWQIFTHLGDPENTARINIDGEGLIRRLYQPGRWHAREYIKDEQSITLPADWNANSVTFYLGLWQGDSRMDITHGANDGDRRARAVTIPVTTPVEPPSALPSLNVPRVSSAITIDGELNEPAWATAATTGNMVNPVDIVGASSAGAFPSNAKILWDATNLYVAFEVTDTFLKSDPTTRDGHLWEQDTVEIMVDPDGDNLHYFELQVAPTGQFFDTHYDGPRTPMNAEENLFGHKDWNPRNNVRVRARGTVNDTQADEGYVVEMAIPWAQLSYGDTHVAAPGVDGTLRINFYVMNQPQEGTQSQVAWSPSGPDFHNASRFGTLRFVEAAAAPTAAAGVPSITEATGTSVDTDLIDVLNARRLGAGIKRQATRAGAEPRTPAN